MILLIVESPTKARTIKKFLPKGYEVTSSFGHMRDLPKSSMGIDVEKNFAPKYIISRDKQKKVTELKKLASKADKIILASDEDREGEAIAWHLRYILEQASKKKSSSAKPPIFERIVFHEITKTAIEKALEHPRDLDMNLVNAQQARRVLDRLVGYELSPFLWKKLRRGLSAGRVQSVALRFIVAREKEREAFAKKTYFTLRALFTAQDTQETFEAKLTHIDNEKLERVEKKEVFAGTYSITSSTLTSAEEAHAVEQALKSSACVITDIEHKQTKRNPSPPFTTSTLQQTAINRLGYSSKQTMRLAQKLYEQGFITYMRTDSVNLSLESTLSAKKFITGAFGEKYILESPRQYKNRTKGAQEAHEAIRPTYPEKTPDDLGSSLDAQELKLYRLIWQRMIASQMQQAIVDSVKVTIEAKHEEHSYTFSANGSTVRFDGFMAVSGTPPTLTNTIPDLHKNDSLQTKELFVDEKETSAPPRYNEASLVKTLEEREIGRPSTYAPTISTLFDRGYIDRDEQKKLFPQEMGTLVSDLLAEHFEAIIDIDFTASLENTLDEVAQGNTEWEPVVKGVYEPFHKNLEEKIKEVKKKDLTQPVGRNCPDCGKELIERYGRFGKFIGCSDFPECKFIEKTKKEEISSGVKCPSCKEGDLVMRKTRRGKVFYGCNRFPKCKTAYWDKPTGKPCSKCTFMLVEDPKGIVRCSNKECEDGPKPRKKSS